MSLLLGWGAAPAFRITMQNSPELANAERHLNTARVTFNVARMELGTILSGLKAREGASDRLIYHADEYGVEHTMKVLAKDPSSFELPGPLPASAMARIENNLARAYRANQDIDAAMANRETVAATGDPSHPKAVLFDGKELIPDPATGGLRDKASGMPFPLESRDTDQGDGDADHDRS